MEVGNPNPNPNPHPHPNPKPKPHPNPGDYERVQGVVGHEYFHNWSGNRVTCRDWFQLTLKEGFTVYRDQHFTSDMTSAAVKRIEDARIIRSAQFTQDAGPMAHPIRPESYIAMDNFYTVTVYNKGAEVIRMYRTLLGEAGFRKGNPNPNPNPNPNLDPSNLTLATSP